MSARVDPTETYEVHKMMGCGEGHFWAPGFTHIEAGEVCPLGHDEDHGDIHLYYRYFLVPIETSSGENMWEYLNRSENRGKIGYLPVVK